MAGKSASGSNVLRFTIKAVGPPRSEKQIRKDVSDALEEAIKVYKAEVSTKKIFAETEPEGAFTGLEIVAWWLLKTFGAGVVSGAGGAAGKKLFGYFSAGLKRRNFNPGPATDAKAEDVKKPARANKKSGKKKT
jgi:hypothetical protein